MQVQELSFKQFQKLSTGGTSSVSICFSTLIWSIQERSELLQLGQGTRNLFPFLLINKSFLYFSSSKNAYT